MTDSTTLLCTADRESRRYLDPRAARAENSLSVCTLFLLRLREGFAEEIAGDPFRWFGSVGHCLDQVIAHAREGARGIPVQRLIQVIRRFVIALFEKNVFRLFLERTEKNCRN